MDKAMDLGGVFPQLRQVDAGDFLFRQNDRSFGVFALVRGRMRLTRITRDGVTVPVHSITKPGELFAEASLFSDRYHCNAEALAASQVWVYPKAELTERLGGNAEALWAFAASLARRVQGLRELQEIRRIRNACERVKLFLELHCDADRVWRSGGTLKLLAEDLGLTHEALYRALARLESDGLISKEEGAIRLLSAD